MEVTLEPTQVLNANEAAHETNSWGKRRTFKPEQLIEAATLLGQALSGNRRKMIDLQEALSTSDFPILLGGVFERELMARYEEITPVWSQYAARTVVKDFRPKKFVDLFGGRAILDPVPQGTEYPARTKEEKEYSLGVAKRGGRFQITFEDIVNDDLDAMRTFPDDLAQSAIDTENYVGASLLVNDKGINTDFFKTGNGNAPTKLPLTTENLDKALTTVKTRKDEDGRPVLLTGFVLVVPPELETQARRILNATEIRTTVDNVTTVETNYLKGTVRLVVDPWMSVINRSAKAGGSWFIVPEPASRRKALAVGFLRGHETPDIRVKADAGVSIGGGAVSPDEGSYDDDTKDFRARHILGGATLDPIGTYASEGA